jgi:hypothetical protein
MDDGIQSTHQDCQSPVGIDPHVMRNTMQKQAHQLRRKESTDAMQQIVSTGKIVRRFGEVAKNILGHIRPHATNREVAEFSAGISGKCGH